jgi:transketolase
MFVLLGVGLAMAVAFAMAMSHCANRRRHQAVEYSRQQDIEVRSMSSIGDLW